MWEAEDLSTSTASIVETGNQSWRFRSSTAKVKGAKTSRTKLLKGDEETAVSKDLSTIL